MWNLNLSLFFLIFLTTLCLSNLLTISVSGELCHPDDKRVLLAIKHDFGDPYILTSWKKDTDCCSWYCVQCDPKTHRITAFTVFSPAGISDGLAGHIPASIGDLPYLEELMLRKQSALSGPIPNAIAKLKNLKSLTLSSNNLSGPVPSFLTGLKNLDYMDLSFNSLSGLIPPSLSNIPNLQTVRLDRNQITGSIPESFGSFKRSDTYIYLSHNRLSGPIPSALGRANFNVLDFSRNQLSGDASFLFGKNKKLERIDLSRNLLEFDISKLEFGSSLTSIDLNHNKIYGSIPKSLANVPGLQLWDVSYNRLCGQIPTGGKLKQFDKTSYINNRCLCGTPLPACH